MGITSDQCFFVTLGYIELLILWTDVLKVVLMVQDKFVFTIPEPEECWLPTLPDVIPGICSILANAVIARYGVDRILRVFPISHDVTVRGFSRNPLDSKNKKSIITLSR